MYYIFASPTVEGFALRIGTGECTGGQSRTGAVVKCFHKKTLKNQILLCYYLIINLYPES